GSGQNPPCLRSQCFTHPNGKELFSRQTRREGRPRPYLLERNRTGSPESWNQGRNQTGACSGRHSGSTLQRRGRVRYRNNQPAALRELSPPYRATTDASPSPAIEIQPRAAACGQIPIIDLFAGPGGLSEGFSAFELPNGVRPFKVVLSIEKDPT